jgi:hypothetical protein
MAPMMTVRKNVPVVLALVALVVQFSPQLSDAQRSIGSSGLWLAAVIFNILVSPDNLEDSPPRIIWDERDSGEQFTIVMFHLLLLTISFFIAYQIAADANDDGGASWMNVLASLVAASGIWLVWTNWNKRNVR